MSSESETVSPLWKRCYCSLSTACSSLRRRRPRPLDRKPTNEERLDISFSQFSMPHDVTGAVSRPAPSPTTFHLL